MDVGRMDGSWVIRAAARETFQEGIEIGIRSEPTPFQSVGIVHFSGQLSGHEVGGQTIGLASLLHRIPNAHCETFSSLVQRPVPVLTIYRL